MQTVEVEMWCAVDSNGDYGLGKDQDAARANYNDDVGDIAECDGFRLVKITVKVPLPIVAELTGEVAEQGEPAELTAK